MKFYKLEHLKAQVANHDYDMEEIQAATLTAAKSKATKLRVLNNTVLKLFDISRQLICIKENDKWINADDLPVEKLDY